MKFIDEKIRVICEKLKEWTIKSSSPISNVKYIPCTYKVNNTPPSSDKGWMTYVGEELDQGEMHYWFQFSVDVPDNCEHTEYRLHVTTGKDTDWDISNPQGTLFVDGDSAYQALDGNHTYAPLAPGHHDVFLYFYKAPSSIKVGFYVSEVDTAIESLYYDLFVPYQAMLCLEQNSDHYIQICNALDRATMELDLRHPYSESFYSGVRAAAQYLQQEFYDRICGEKSVEIGAIGHTHIDVAWLWTLAQTREKAQRSFSTVIRLMEKYPDYIFMSSQPQLYSYVKENDPALYEKIKEKVKEGRWEVEGAMWLEADTNLVGGESLIRQLLYGKQFMKDEFNVDSRILWMPDVFGYSAALPQILRKSGVDRFFTTKISWNETNSFPHDHFIWQGIDGSEIFSVISDKYVKQMTPRYMYNTWAWHKDKKFTNTTISTFGFGDGGGGPTMEMLENYNRLKKGLPGFPKIIVEKSAQTLDRIEEQFQNSTQELRFLPKWVGELYLEMHRGTYTSIAKNKKNNRKSEYMYQTAEALAVTSSLCDQNYQYPVQALREQWHTILKNQFHDIIPGSSIKEVYDDSDREYAHVLKTGEEVIQKGLSVIARNLDTDGGLLVYNPGPFEMNGTITIEDKSMLVCDVPAHGWKVVQPAFSESMVTIGDHYLENDCVRVAFDEKYHIVSFKDKRNDRELIASGEIGNVLEVYEDYPRVYDAWEITEYYRQKKWVADDVTAVEAVDNGVRAGVRITRNYGNSRIVQTITLQQGSPRLDFDTYVDWQEDHVLLKTVFPLDIRASHANYEIQFGHIERPTHRNTSWDQAKFEVCAHKWADLSEDNYGVSLLNDCKYGYSTEENRMSLTLLKAATYPNPVADRGEHTFSYALYPHTGRVGIETIREAYAFNMPLLHKAVSKQQGTLPEVYSLIRCESDSFVIETIKQSEDGAGIIVRGYEACGQKTEVSLSLPFACAKAEICDLMETVLEEIPVEENRIALKAGNYEIITLKITPQ